MSNFNLTGMGSDCNNLILNNASSLVLFGAANVAFGTSGTGGVIKAKIDNGSLDLQAGTGGIVLDSTFGNSDTSGTVGGPINLVSQANSSWTNSSSDLTLQTITSGDLVIDSAEAVQIGNTNSTSVSIGRSGQPTNINGDVSVNNTQISPTAYILTNVASDLIIPSSFLSTKYIYNINTSTLPISITLPAITSTPVIIVITDGGNNASMNNITILPAGINTIGFNPSYPINADGFTVQLSSNLDNNWIIG